MIMHQAIPSTNISPPWQAPGNFFDIVESPALWQNVSAKGQPWDKKTPTPREYFERSSQLSLLIGVEILESLKSPELAIYDFSFWDT